MRFKHLIVLLFLAAIAVGLLEASSSTQSVVKNHKKEEVIHPISNNAQMVYEYEQSLQQVRNAVFIDTVTRQQVADYLSAQYEQALIQQQALQQSMIRNAPVQRNVTSNSNPGDFLSCVRNRESGGNYGIYNSGGSGAAGAYQFLPGTWNSIAASSGRSDLIGVDPAQASPADQDSMAQSLYAQQGAAPWGGGC